MHLFTRIFHFCYSPFFNESNNNQSLEISVAQPKLGKQFGKPSEAVKRTLLVRLELFGAVWLSQLAIAIPN